MADNNDDEFDNPLPNPPLPPPAHNPAAPRPNGRRLEIAADPGRYNGAKATFGVWWTKMLAWIRVNRDLFQGQEEICIAVWSRLEGATAGTYGETRLRQCMESEQWPTFQQLMREVTSRFQSATEIEWARAKIETFKQGNMRVDDFITQFGTLVIKGQIEEMHGISLLERNTKDSIIQQMFQQGRRQTTVQDTCEEILAIGRAEETYAARPGMRTGNNFGQQRTGWGNRPANQQNQQRPFGQQQNGGYRAPQQNGQQGQGRRDPNAMEVDRNQRRAPGNCYNCGGQGHFARECRQPQRKVRAAVIEQIDEHEEEEILRQITARRQARQAANGPRGVIGAPAPNPNGQNNRQAAGQQGFVNVNQ